MRLSNKSTFCLVFAVLLIAGFAIVPTAMAAEGGPRVLPIVLDASMTTGTDGPDGAAAMMDDNIGPKATVTNGNALLTKSAQFMGTSTERADLVDVLTDTDDGTFRLILTFDRDVYPAATARPDDPNDPDTAIQDRSGTRTIAVGDLATGEITIISALGLVTGVDERSNVTVTNVARMVKEDPTPDTPTSGDEVYELRKFYVTIQVADGAYDNLPLNIALAVNANAVFGIGKNRVITPFADDQPGLGNVGYSATEAERDAGYQQFDFQVVARAISGITIAGRPSGAIRSHQPIVLTLTFDPGLHESDIPTRMNIVVTNGDIKTDDSATTDMDEGITDLSPTNAPRTRYMVTILPRGGLGDTYTITVTNAVGAAFELNESYQVNNLPEAQRVTITGPTNVPIGGAPFAVTIVYSVAPATPLTAAGITVENGSIVAGSFSGSVRNYTVRIDPNNPTADNPVTVTVRVGQDFATFITSLTDTTGPGPVTPDDPNAPVEITLTAGIDAGKYLVVTPATIVYDDATTTDVDESVNADVLPQALEVTVRETAAAMPDLEDLLYGGGTIDVYVDAGAGNPIPDIIINEVMWGLDENEVGTDGHTAHQWIELYNNSNDNATAGTITLWFKPRTLTGAPSDEGPRTDRLSNVVRFGTTTGWQLGDNHGQSGNSDEESTKEFISMYRKSDKRGNDDGVNGAHWLESTELSHVKHRGTPGKENTRSAVTVTTRPKPAAFTPPKSHVLINEVHNNSNNDLDWLELRFLQKTNLENWTLSYAKSDFSESEIMRFPKREFQAGDIVLIVNKGPQDTNLVAGQDVTLGAENQDRGAGSHKYWNPSGGNSGSGHYLDIPDYNGGNFFLILRTGKGWERLNGSRDRMHDVVGPAAFHRKTLNADSVIREPNTENPADGKKGYIWETETWPINGQDLRAHNADGSNNGNAFLQPDRKFTTGSIWARNGTNHGWRKDGISNPGNRGGLGYDRGVAANGTPGYDNGIVKGKSTDLANGTVVVSELMLTTDNGRYPQWVELHNTSDNTVDLHADTDGNGARQGWSIRVENHFSDSWSSRRKDKLNVEVKFRDLAVRFIPPNQTILIVADRVRNSKASFFPNHRVATIWGTGARGVFKMENRRDIFLNPNGFLLQVVDGNGVVSDAVGNLDGKGPDIFDAANIDFDSPSDNGDWEWPSQDDMIIRNRRTSLIRLYDAGEARMGTPDGPESKRGAVLPIGIDNVWLGKGETGQGEHMLTHARYAGYAWVHAVDTKLAQAQITWYGSEDDYGTPLHTTGTPLPVSLSFFRPTLEDGKVVIRWTTESELDNAGFNIYRSEDRNGEFTKVNDQLIQGKGTTAERSTYKWVDTSAKPGAVYYYQIEDVSFAGERVQLATTKLKGLISAQNKLTTKWGELKEVQ